MTIQKIIPHLWFDTQAKEAAEYYVSVFPNSKIIRSQTITDTPSGDVEIVNFELSRQRFDAISAGPYFTFTEAVSFVVRCDTQEEIDYYWKSFRPYLSPSNVVGAKISSVFRGRSSRQRWTR